MGRRHSMRLRISPLEGDLKETVRDTLKDNPQYFDGYDDLTTLHAHFYQVVNKDNYVMGFFALCYWENEVVLACLFVFEDFRNMGVFNAITKFAKRKTPWNCWLTINAMRTNTLANEIYDRKFKFFRYDKEDDINWYIMKRAHIKKRGGD